MIEVRKSHLRIISAALTNIGSALVLLPLATSDISARIIALISGIILFRIAIFIEDLSEKVYG